MKLLRNRQFAAAVSAAALVGISITSAFAAPNYVPPANSPLDTTTLNSESALLDAFNGYLDNIQAALPVGTTLSKPDLGVSVAPTDVQLYAAVAAAVAADTAHAYEIVAAAIQYRGSKAKDIVKNVVAITPASAPDAVAGASNAAPKLAGDAAAGAILALIGAAGTAADMADAADEAVIAQTRELIEKVAKTAVAATKTAAGQNSSAGAVAAAIVDAVLADAASSNAILFIDDTFRGIVAGAANFTATNQSVLAALALSRFSGSPLATKHNLANAAMGALKGAKILAGPDGFDDTNTALQAAADAIVAGGGAVVAAGAKAQKALREAAATTEDATFSSNLTSAEAADEFLLYAYVSGAVQALKGRAKTFVTLALTDADVGVLSVAQKQAVVSAAITGNFGSTSGVVLNGITAASNGLTAVDAVTAAIPAASDLFSGTATLAAIKNNPLTAAADQQAVLAAAINTAEAAGYDRAYADIALGAAKAAKLVDNDLVATAIAEVKPGWEAAVAAAIISNNAKESAYIGFTLGSNEAAALDAATLKGADVIAVGIAMKVAQGGKLSGKTLFDDAINELYTVDGAARPHAVLLGAGIVNKKNQIPLLAAALRLNTGAITDAALLDYAISLDKKKKTNAELGYIAALDAINSPDNIFDGVDHLVLSNPKNAVDIVSGSVGARPEYAHFAARAATFRAPGSAGKIGSAAITYGHMRANRDSSGAAIADPNDPAAVAAIAAAVVLGVKDAKLVTLKEEAAIKSAVGSIVKASLAFTNPGLLKTDPSFKAGLVGNSDTFPEATGAGTDPLNAANFVLRRSKGTAAAITGAVANLMAEGDTVLSSLAKVAITAAAKAAKLHGLAIAQAAGAAAAAVAAFGGNVFADFASIAAAFTGTGVLATAVQLENAARLGANQYTAGTFGAGAAGILNYAHHSGNTPPVTDLSNF